MAEAKFEEYKVVVCGPGGAGKSCLTNMLVVGLFTEEYDPTIEDSYRKQVSVDGEDAVLDILDTAGQEEYSSMLDEYLRKGQGFLLVYSITSRESFEEIPGFMEKMLRAKDTKQVPTVLVGNKKDLEHKREVSFEEGNGLAADMGANFLESSAKLGEGVEDAFYNLIREVRKDRDAKGYTLNKTNAPGKEMSQKLKSKFARWGFGRAIKRLFGRNKTKGGSKSDAEPPVDQGANNNAAAQPAAQQPMGGQQQPDPHTSMSNNEEDYGGVPDNQGGQSSGGMYGGGQPQQQQGGMYGQPPGAGGQPGPSPYEQQQQQQPASGGMYGGQPQSGGGMYAQPPSQESPQPQAGGGGMAGEDQRRGTLLGGAAPQGPRDHTQEPWFHGNLPGPDADRMLEPAEPGTFLVRASAQPGCFAVSWKSEDNVVRKSLVIQDETVGFYFSDVPHAPYPTLQELVIASSHVLQYPLVNRNRGPPSGAASGGGPPAIVPMGAGGGPPPNSGGPPPIQGPPSGGGPQGGPSGPSSGSGMGGPGPAPSPGGPGPAPSPGMGGPGPAPSPGGPGPAPSPGMGGPGPAPSPGGPGPAPSPGMGGPGPAPSPGGPGPAPSPGMGVPGPAPQPGMGGPGPAPSPGGPPQFQLPPQNQPPQQNYNQPPPQQNFNQPPSGGGNFNQPPSGGGGFGGPPPQQNNGPPGFAQPGAPAQPFGSNSGGEIRVGARVRWMGQHMGVVRFYGEGNFAKGIWVGIELDEPQGKNDGTVKGQRYFECAPGHGIFTNPNKVEVIQ